jgi:protein disulfide-isomerase A1
MNAKLLILFIAACFAAKSMGGVVPVSGMEEWAKVVAESSPLLVKFYAPWCGHCKKLAPIYEEAAEALDGEAVLAKVDCTADENKAVCSKYDIKGFPTLKIFDGSQTKFEDYSAGRTKNDIVSTMKKANKPAVSDITSSDQLIKLVEENTVVAVLYNLDGSDMEAFTEFASQNKASYTFAVITDATVTDIGAASGEIYLHRNFDEPLKFDGTVADRSKFFQFLVAESFPPLGDIGPDTYQSYVDRGLPLVWCFIDYTKEESKEELSNVYTAVAKQYLGQLSFVRLDGVQWERHAAHYGINSLPGVVIEEPNKTKYILDSSTSHTDKSNVEKFFNDWRAGSLTPFVKSDPVPDNSDNAVKIIVGDTFDEYVTNRKQGIFVKYYAPWCGHCKKLAPTWEELGEAFKNHQSDVLIAKLDATTNDHKEAVSGFPTLVYYPKNGNKVNYSGARDLESLTAWISEKAGVTLEDAVDGDDYSGHDEL